MAGALVNKFGCRATAIIGSFVAAFGFAISYYAPNVQFLYVSIGLVGGKVAKYWIEILSYKKQCTIAKIFFHFCMLLSTGLGLGLIYLPAIVSVTTYFDKRRAFATGIAVSASFDNIIHQVHKT